MKPMLWIDAGHGAGNVGSGYDPGAIGNGHTEADVVLSIALAGRWILNNEFGIPVWLTRDDDSDYSPVATRDNRALQAGCTVGISIHMNAGPAKATGTETFYRHYPKWATDVQQAALKAWGLRDRGLKTEGQSQHSRLAVLDFLPPPMCLLEVGFITNKSDLTRVLERDRRIAFWRNIGQILDA
jgi:N-acetylmuramoyl-L-alanine amidase